MYPYQDPALRVEERVADLISRMEIREKVGQLTQSLYGFHCYTRHGDTVELSDILYKEMERYGSIGSIYGLFRADPWAQKDFETGLVGALAIRTRNRIQEYVMTHSRLGIPVLFATECPHGHQTPDGYLLPVNLASASSFSPKLVQEAFSVCGQQMKDVGVDLAYVSVMDVLRDPRWGRSEECLGEDPYLASVMARSIVSTLKKAGVDVVAKHFCAQGDCTGGINSAAVNIGMRELREIHLPPVRAAVEAGAASVMSTYHEIDGVYCTANSMLNIDVLRGEMGFEGFVMADALAVDQLDRITGDRMHTVALAVNAGVDMGLLDHAFEHLEEAVKQGLVTEARLDEAVARILRLKFERGLFDHPYLDESTDWTGYTYGRYPQSLSLCEQSMVLLKNEESILPLSQAHHGAIAVIGPLADNPYRQCGDYTPPLREDGCITVWQGLQAYTAERCPHVGLQLVNGPELFETDFSKLAQYISAMDGIDTVIAVIGGSSDRFGVSRISAGGQVEEQATLSMDCGEGIDSASLTLPGMQIPLLRALKEAGKKVVTVLIGGRPYEMKEIDRYSDAILLSFYPGPMGGEAIPKLLFGEIAPAGRLPVSLPEHAGTIPVYYNYKRSSRAMKYYDSPTPTKYAFGYGLTYTDFVYRLEKAPDGEERTLRFTVTNTGERGAYAVPQLYLYRETGEIAARIRELCGFDKIYLKPGESKSVLISIPDESLCQWDLSMKHRLVPGKFSWYLCDMGRTELSGEFTV